MHLSRAVDNPRRIGSRIYGLRRVPEDEEPVGPLYVREFDGSDDTIIIEPDVPGSLGAMHDDTPGSTVIAVFKPMSDSGDRCIATVGQDGPTLVAPYLDSSDVFRWGSDSPSASRSSGITLEIDTWYIIALTRPTGDPATVGFHVCEVGGAWQHNESGGSVVSVGSIPNNMKIANFNAGGYQHMQIAVWACLLGPRTDGQLETVVDSTDQILNLVDSANDVVLQFNQDDVTTPVEETTDSNGIWAETARTGSTVIEAEDLIWEYH